MVQHSHSVPLKPAGKCSMLRKLIPSVIKVNLNPDSGWLLHSLKVPSSRKFFFFLMCWFSERIKSEDAIPKEHTLSLSSSQMGGNGYTSTDVGFLDQTVKQHQKMFESIFKTVWESVTGELTKDLSYSFIHTSSHLRGWKTTYFPQIAGKSFFETATLRFVSMDVSWILNSKFMTFVSAYTSGQVANI